MLELLAIGHTYDAKTLKNAAGLIIARHWRKVQARAEYWEINEELRTEAESNMVWLLQRMGRDGLV